MRRVFAWVVVLLLRAGAAGWAATEDGAPPPLMTGRPQASAIREDREARMEVRREEVLRRMGMKWEQFAADHSGDGSPVQRISCASGTVSHPEPAEAEAVDGIQPRARARNARLAVAFLTIACCSLILIGKLIPPARAGMERPSRL